MSRKPPEDGSVVATRVYQRRRVVARPHHTPHWPLVLFGALVLAISIVITRTVLG